MVVTLLQARVDAPPPRDQSGQAALHGICRFLKMSVGNIYIYISHINMEYLFLYYIYMIYIYIIYINRNININININIKININTEYTIYIYIYIYISSLILLAGWVYCHTASCKAPGVHGGHALGSTT